eukprot:SAG11_NODE_35920_length_264_cov_0.927273_1_plen_41_part_10
MMIPFTTQGQVMVDLMVNQPKKGGVISHQIRVRNGFICPWP